MAESQQTSAVNKEFHNQPLMNGAYQTIDSWGLPLDFHECLYNVGPIPVASWLWFIPLAKPKSSLPELPSGAFTNIMNGQLLICTIDL